MKDIKKTEVTDVLTGKEIRALYEGDTLLNLKVLQCLISGQKCPLCHVSTVNWVIRLVFPCGLSASNVNWRVKNFNKVEQFSQYRYMYSSQGNLTNEIKHIFKLFSIFRKYKVDTSRWNRKLYVRKWEMCSNLFVERYICQSKLLNLF